MVIQEHEGRAVKKKVEQGEPVHTTLRNKMSSLNSKLLDWLKHIHTQTAVVRR
jgi:hypothetical protein